MPITLPDMTELGVSVRVLPVPANWTAAIPPLMLPEFKIDEPPTELATIPN